jgi:hypothetical protein
MSTYVYGIVAASHPQAVEELTGVGDPPAPLRRVIDDGLAALISDAPEQLQGKRRDLQAHEQVLEACCESGPVVPMQFGSVADDDHTVRTQLRSGHDRYARLLSELAGRVEVNVKARPREDELLRQVLTESPQLRRLNEELRAGGGGTYEQRLSFGETVASAVQDRLDKLSHQIVTAVRQHALREREGSAVEGNFLNMSFLIDHDALSAIEEEVDKLRESSGQFMELRLYGPLPPYSFTEPAETE